MDPTDLDHSIVKLALDRGLVTGDQVRQARKDSTAADGIAQVLVRRRMLEAAQMHELAAAVMQGQSGADRPEPRKVTHTVAVAQDDEVWEHERAVLTEGSRLGRYHIVRELGRGAMGAVYRAYDPDLDREVAIKVLVGGALASEAQIKRFRREAAIAAKLSHPYLVGVHDVGMFSGAPYFTMDLVEGGSLADRIEREGPCPDPRAGFRLLAKVAWAIEHLHEHGVVHRDLKPSNIMLDEEGEPRVADFGLAADISSDSRLTLSNQVFGTPYYMAPEQFMSAKDVGPKADIWALGVVCYEWLAGRPPFLSETPRGIMEEVLYKEPSDLRKLRPGTPAAAVAVTMRAMEKAIPGRYATAAEMATDLERFARGEPVHARQRGLGTRIYRRAFPYRRVIQGAALAVVLAAAGGWYALRQRHVLAVRAGVNDAREALARDDYEGVAKAVAAVLSREPGHAEARYLRARAHVALSCHDAALADLTPILAGDPDGTWHLLRSAALRALGRTAEADADLERARKIGGAAFDAETARLEAAARKARDQNFFAQASNYAGEVLQRKPGMGEMHAIRLRALTEDGKLAEALPDLRALASLEPGKLDYRVKLGMALAKAAERDQDGRLADEALETFDHLWPEAGNALAKSDGFFHHYNIAIARAFAGQPDTLLQRARRYQWAANHNKSNENHNRTCSLHELSKVLRAMGRHDDAFEALKVAAESDRGFLIYTKLELATHWEALGELDRALAELGEVEQATRGQQPGSLMEGVHETAVGRIREIERRRKDG